jgi:hypothetical protein
VADCELLLPSDFPCALQVLVLASVVYVGVGMLYKRFALGSSGLEAIPNIEFWRSFFGNVHAGGQVIYYGITCKYVVVVDVIIVIVTVVGDFCLCLCRGWSVIDHVVRARCW